MLKNILLFLFLSLSATLFSQEWRQNKEETQAEFIFKNFGIKVGVAFSDILINTNFNNKDLPNSYINGIIKVKSLSSGLSIRDKIILKKRFFYEKKHKIIQFISSKIFKKENGDFYCFIDLEIRGIKKKIKIPLVISQNDKNLKMSTNFQINRKDFKIGGNSLVLSDNTNIKVQFVGKK